MNWKLCFRRICKIRMRALSQCHLSKIALCPSHWHKRICQQALCNNSLVTSNAQRTNSHSFGVKNKCVKVFDICIFIICKILIYWPHLQPFTKQCTKYALSNIRLHRNTDLSPEICHLRQQVPKQFSVCSRKLRGQHHPHIVAWTWCHHVRKHKHTSVTQ